LLFNCIHVNKLLHLVVTLSCRPVNSMQRLYRTARIAYCCDIVCTDFIDTFIFAPVDLLRRIAFIALSSLPPFSPYHSHHSRRLDVDWVMSEGNVTRSTRHSKCLHRQWYRVSPTWRPFSLLGRYSDWSFSCMPRHSAVIMNGPCHVSLSLMPYWRPRDSYPPMISVRWRSIRHVTNVPFNCSSQLAPLDWLSNFFSMKTAFVIGSWSLPSSAYSLTVAWMWWLAWWLIAD